MIIIILLGSAYTFLQIWFDDVCSLRMVQSAGIASSKVISGFSKLILLSVTHHLRLFSLFILIYSKSSTSIIISYHLLLVFKVMKKVSFGGREVLCSFSDKRNAYSSKLLTNATDISGTKKQWRLVHLTMICSKRKPVQRS